MTTPTIAMRAEIAGKAKTYTLIYSETMAEMVPPNRAMTNEGKEVEYTGMIDEAEYGPWNQTYARPDTRKVGEINSCSQITHISEKPWLFALPMLWRA